MAVTWASSLGWRLRRHFLEGERASTAAEVVDRLVAIPSWSGDAATAIGLRLGRCAGEELRAAVVEGQVVSTYAFRGATHLMTPSSASVHLAIRCAGRQWERASWRTYYRLEPNDWPRLRDVVREALADGPLTQSELAAAVSRHHAYRHLRSAFEDKSHTLIKPFGWQGDLCFAPSTGEPTFRSLESLPGWPGLADLDDAGPQAIRAYLAAYGPASRAQIHYWLGQGLSAGRKRLDGWIDGLADELVVLRVDGAEAICLAEDAAELDAAAASDAVVLLPGFDQWILGPGTSDTQIVPTDQRPLATRGANLVIIGGRVGGSWKLDRDVIKVTWLNRSGPGSPSALDAAVRDLSAATGRTLHTDP